MNIAAIVQARMGSTRLPGKVLKPLRGASVLCHVVRRVAQSKTVNRVIVATTDLPEDRAIVEEVSRLNVEVVEGSPTDVLSRYMLAWTHCRADHVVRVTADCPCIDPDVVDRVVRMHLAAGADYSSNIHPRRSFPHGLDVEVIRQETLEVANRDAAEEYERELVLPFVWSRPERFRLANVVAERHETFPELRITLDTPADYLMLQALYDLLPIDFRAADIVRVALNHPWLSEINGHERQKRVPLETDPVARIRAEVMEAATWARLQELYGAAELLRSALDRPDLLAQFAVANGSERASG